MSFKAVRIYVFTAVDLEAQLIDHYGGLSAVLWNGSGFGSNDPGRERDTSTYKDDHFDALYPIDIDRSIRMDLPSTAVRAETVLRNLKDVLPYVFRYQGARRGSRKPHPDLERTNIIFRRTTEGTARAIIKEIMSQLPVGWQATQLPSHLILYKENKAYPQGALIARSSG